MVYSTLCFASRSASAWRCDLGKTILVENLPFLAGCACPVSLSISYGWFCWGSCLQGAASWCLSSCAVWQISFLGQFHCQSNLPCFWCCFIFPDVPKTLHVCRISKASQAFAALKIHGSQVSEVFLPPLPSACWWLLHPLLLLYHCTLLWSLLSFFVCDWWRPLELALLLESRLSHCLVGFW